MSLTQDQVDKLSAGFDTQNALIADIAQDVTTLQGQVAAGGDQATADLLQPLVDKITAANAALQSVDDETPNPDSGVTPTDPNT